MRACEKSLWDERCEQIGQKKTSPQSHPDVKFGKSRTIGNMWVCVTAPRNVCRSRAIVANAALTIDKCRLNTSHHVRTT